MNNSTINRAIRNGNILAWLSDQNLTFRVKLIDSFIAMTGIPEKEVNPAFNDPTSLDWLDKHYSAMISLWVDENM